MNIKEMLLKQKKLLKINNIFLKNPIKINKKTLLAFAFFILGTSTGFRNIKDIDLVCNKEKEEDLSIFQMDDYDDLLKQELSTYSLPSFPIEEEITEKTSDVEEVKTISVKDVSILDNQYSLYENMIVDESVIALYEEEERKRIHSSVLENYELSDSDYFVLADNIIAVSNELGTGYSSYEAVDRFFYDLSNISKEEKVCYILEHYDLTPEEFQVLSACVLAEAKGDATCYIDAYAVVNTIYNRVISNSWSNAFSDSLYQQVMGKGQFQVIDDQRYLEYMNTTDGLGYDAVLDLLYSEVPMHNYLKFVANEREADGKVQFVPSGNRYHSRIRDRKSEKY